MVAMRAVMAVKSFMVVVGLMGLELLSVSVRNLQNDLITRWEALRGCSTCTIRAKFCPSRA